MCLPRQKQNEDDAQRSAQPSAVAARWGRGSEAGGGGGLPGGLCRGGAVGIEAAEVMNRNGDVPEAMCGFCASRCPVEGQHGQEQLPGCRSGDTGAQGGISLGGGGVCSNMRSGIY